MLWPGIKKLGKELRLKRTDSEVIGFIKNCFVKLYDGNNMKILELFVPEMSDDDKNNIIKKLEARKIKRYEWISNGVKITFIEIFAPYSMKKIKELMGELVNYFSNKYPVQKPLCQYCGQQNETDVYCINNNVSLLICDECHNKIEKDIQNENTGQQNAKGNYLSGFVDAVLFATPGIILTVLFFVFLERLAAVSAIAYVYLGVIGYKKFKGKISPIGAVIIIFTALILTAIGVTIAYSVFIIKEAKMMINIDELILYLKIPEIKKELLSNILITYLVSGFFFALQFKQLISDWRNRKIIKKPREICRTHN